jgi:putative ABC transport system permease protein
MRASTLLRRNLTYFWRTNLAVVLGVATAVAVLAGALLVGDSVRASLRELASARLGRADLVVTAPGFFREQLADDLRAHAQFAAYFDSACPLIALAGVVTREEGKARAGGVQVYGVDERFWKFHGRERAAVEGDDVLVSDALARELGANAGDTLIVRIEKETAIPADSLHGQKDDLGVTLRSTLREALPAASLGEFSLRPQQGAVRAVFVRLNRLQRALEQGGKANTMLLAAKDVNAGGQALVAAGGRMLKDVFQLADLGLKLRALDAPRSVALESDAALLDDQTAERARAAAGKLGLRTTEVLSYLANTIRSGEREIPYSLVTALDESSLNRLANFSATEPERPDSPQIEGGPESAQRIFLNDWAARELGAKPGDDVTLAYYLWRDEGKLETREAGFKVAGVLPLKGAAADRDYTPDYPGITDSKSLGDWNPPFPVDLSRVRPQDEKYWDDYRTTPKAFVSLAAGQKLWASRYGKLTSLRVSPMNTGDLPGVQASFERELRAALDPAQLGLMVQPVREQSLAASRGATDFGEYFAYFSFFLVVSALLLAGLFFKLGVEQRLREIGLLGAIGFPAATIRALFLGEGALLAAAGSLLGLAGAVGYGALMMYGLRTWWVGAVGTTHLSLHVTPLSLIIGFVGGVLMALAVVVLALRRVGQASPRSLLAGVVDGGRQVRGGSRWTFFAPRSARPLKLFTASRLAVAFGLIGLLLLGGALLKFVGQVAGFFGAGGLFLVAALCFWSARLKGGGRQLIQGGGWWPVSRLGFRFATSRPGRSVLCIALIASATFIIVAVDAFRRDGAGASYDQKSGTGGYPLLAESLLPIVHDPNTAEGRESLVIDATGDDTLAGVQFARFRLRPGDDASCLNLYQPRNPRILAPTADFIRAGRFAFQSSLPSRSDEFQSSPATTQAEPANPWLLLEKDFGDGTIPVIADATSLAYALHLKLGDVMTTTAGDGSPVKLRVVAALKDSVFQSELLMAEKHFLGLFPEQEGWRFFLIDAAPEKAAAVSALLEEKLADFGFDATGTAERLAEYHRVENTYLSTFQALGGLGLLLGTVGLAAALLRNVLERRRELALLRATGYQASHLSLMVVAENALLLACGLVTGVACALLAIAPAFFARGGSLSAVSLGLLLLAVLVTGLAASLVAVAAVRRAPLLAALRAE